MRKFVDLSGFGISGKGAYIDLFKEFEGYDCPPADFEFDLLRIKDGLLDLKHALVDNWSPVRSSVAIKRFRKTVIDLGANPSKWNILQSLRISGARYNRMFDERFVEISMEYINSIIEDTYYGLSVFPMQDDSDINRIVKKILKKAGNQKAFYTENYIVSGKNFETKTQEYLLKLFKTRDKENTSTYVLYNAFEPYNPLKSMKLFPSSKSIIIDRDPRDIYLSALEHKFPNDVPKDLITFVRRFKLFREKIVKSNSKDILYVTFEELILDYDKTVNKIFDFLDETSLVHKYPKKYFIPEISRKGIGMWKNSPRQSEIDYIHEHLNEYCKDY